MSSLKQKLREKYRILDSVAGASLAALALLSAPLTAYMLKPEPQPYWEMGTMMMSCEGKEVFLWNGDDRQEIRNNVKEKAEIILSALYANPMDEDIVRIKGKSAADQFVEKSSAYSMFSSQFSLAMALSQETETSFTPEGKHEITYLKEQNIWVYEQTGIFTKTTDKNGSVRLTIRIAYTRSNGDDPMLPGSSLKNRKKMTLIISHMEVEDEGPVSIPDVHAH